MSMDELVAEVERLWEVCGAQRAENEALRRVNIELRATLEEALRAGKRQATPFRREARGLSTAPKRPGRRAGEGSFSYRKLAEDVSVVEEAPAELIGCPVCSGAVVEVRAHEQFVEDLPVVSPVVRRLVTYSGWCAHCQKRVRSRHPLQTSAATGAAGRMLGPRVIALASDLKHRFGVSYDKVAEYLKASHGLRVTGGGLIQADQQLARRAQPVVEVLIQLIRQCSVVHADETGWRIGTLAAWLWVFTNERITLYTIRAGPGARGHEVVLTILGRDFKGVLVADGFLAYDANALSEWIHQKCLGHILKTLSALSESRQAAAVALASEVTPALRDALALRDERAALTPDAFAARRDAIAERVAAAAAAHADRPAYDEAGRMARHLIKHGDHLFRFLDDPAIAATNNLAERDIRPAVITRKTGGCNRTQGGADNQAVLASVIATLRKNDVDVHGYLVHLQRGTASALADLLMPHSLPAAAR